ncbi:MAG TPA: hypothetical protein VG456_07800 [Candidatus Sulfopaludibacter sp.]|jgi:hypothetical protein|nr:hypothetical protein [Candidatus Sulfopaludibacter sp.]
MRWALCLALCLTPATAQTLDFLNHNRPVLDAHNCYPYDGKFTDRIDRALKTGFPVGIEQDLAWYDGKVVVTHSAQTHGGEPTLRDHFFEKVRPIIEKALKDNDRAHWPIIVLHFDFKDNQEPLIRAVWKLLGEYQGWITTAVKSADPHELTPFDPKPLLVLTEIPDIQEKVFYTEIPVGGKLRLFGSAHTAPITAANKKEENHLLATLPPEKLLVDRATTYRRWWNNSWFEVEEGGQHEAGDWTPADEARLKALVDHAHDLGYWIRFYTLDGFAPAQDQGWGNAYNFGSRDAVLLRWQAAVRAGVNLIASDQYEDLRTIIK